MTATSHNGTSTQTRLTGVWLTLARTSWFVIVVLAMAGFAALIPAFFDAMLDGGKYALALRQIGILPSTYTIYLEALAVIQFAVFSIVGVLIFWRKSNEWWAIFVSVVLITFGAYSTSLNVFDVYDLLGPFRPVVYLMLGISNATFVTFLYIFPDGKFAPKWTLWPVAVWAVWALASGVLPDTPFSIYNLPDTAIFVIPLLYYGGSVAVQNYRHRHYYSPTQKQQTKWMLMGLLISLVGGFVVFAWPPLMFPSLAGDGVSALIYYVISRAVGTLALMAIPIGIAFSILRYRLWDVDFLINRSLVYGSLTVGLIALFLAGFGIVQLLFTHLQEGMNAGIALAVSGAVFGLLFLPARRRLQRLIDQQFYGINIDYNKTPIPASQGFGTVTAGQKLGVYEVTGTLGKGGMAEVFKGRHSTLGREVAIKVLPATFANDPEFRTRFEREARTIGALKHPNIVELYDFGEADGLIYMVMEYISGGDLSEHLRSSGLLAIPETRRLAAAVGDALDYAHLQGVVHRDVKPSNVMLNRASGDLRPVLTDFGIARITGAGTRITRTGMIGTFDYMAPEQIRDAADVDGRADVYSLGIMLFQMLTGRLPFIASNPGALLIAHLNQPAPDPRDVRADIPEEVADVVRTALEKDPAQRYQTAGELVAALA